LDKSSKNVLFTSSWFPSKLHPTLGNFVQRHAEAVALINPVHVLYVVFNPQQEQTYIVDDHEELEVKITIVYCKTAGIFNPLRKRNGFLVGLKHLEERHDFTPDIVHHNVIWKDVWQPWLVHKKYRTPYIITEHWTGFDKQARKKSPFLLKPLAKFFTTNASFICPVTENLAQNMRSMGIKGNYHVVPNVVDTDLFQLSEKPNDKIYFLHVSSLLDAQKNISGILKAWKEAITQNSNIHLTIGGDGPWSPYEKLIAELNIPQANIAFFGEKKWSEIAELMQQSHCLLMFSNYENLPCVIVEALASGMFVISTNAGGIAEHINNERGTLISIGEESELVHAILKFASTNPTTKIDDLRKYAQDNFSKPVIAETFNRIYSSVLKR